MPLGAGGSLHQAVYVCRAVALLGLFCHVPTALYLLTSAFGAVRIMIPGFLHFTVVYVYALCRLLFCIEERLLHEFVSYWLVLHVYVINRVIFAFLTKFNVLASARYTLSILLGLAVALPAAQGWAAVPLLILAIVIFNVSFSLFMDSSQASEDAYSAGGFMTRAVVKRHFVTPEGVVVAPAMQLPIDGRAPELQSGTLSPLREKDRAMIVFEKLDEAGSGKISLRELGDLLVSWGLPRSEAEFTMQEHDRNADGQLNFEEFYRNLRPIWEFAARIVLSNGGGPASSAGRPASSAPPSE